MLSIPKPVQLAIPAIVAVIIVALIFWVGADVGAQTPTSGAAGLRHNVLVFGRDAISAAPEGTTVILSRRLSREEYFRVQETGVGPAACATLTVQSSRIEVLPQFTNDCPEGSPISAGINFNDGEGWIGGNFEPLLEWRPARSGETTRNVSLKPDQPRAGGDGGPIQPPSTGDAAIASRDGGSFWWGYVAFAVSVLLAGLSLAVALVARRRLPTG
jgi:hypothetical protein